MDETEALLNYQEKVGRFAGLVEGAFKLSSTSDSLPVDDWRQEVAVSIFTKLTLHGMAIRALFPLTPAVWDIGSLAVLTRAVIDTYFALFYFAVDDPGSPDQIAFRRLVGNSNLAKHRYQILELLDSGRPEKNEIRSTVESLLSDLKTSPLFKI